MEMIVSEILLHAFMMTIRICNHDLVTIAIGTPTLV